MTLLSLENPFYEFSQIDDVIDVKKYKDKVTTFYVVKGKLGFDISKKRIVDDMNFKLDLVSTVKRLDWIKKKYPLNKVIYMGDGILDYLVMKNVFYSISPANEHEFAKKSADYVTKCSGGNRAVAEASLHIMKKFFKKFDQIKGLKNKSFSGSWKS